jgi:hypothetical protein
MAGEPLETLHLPQDDLRVFQKLLPLRRQGDALLGPQQQGRAYIRLQVPDDVAQVGLGDIQLLRGLIDGAALGDGCEKFQVSDVHADFFTSKNAVNFDQTISVFPASLYTIFKDCGNESATFFCFVQIFTTMSRVFREL